MSKYQRFNFLQISKIMLYNKTAQERWARSFEKSYQVVLALNLSNVSIATMCIVLGALMHPIFKVCYQL